MIVLATIGLLVLVGIAMAGAMWLIKNVGFKSVEQKKENEND
jgi:hypothetical protein